MCFLFSAPFISSFSLVLILLVSLVLVFITVIFHKIPIEKAYVHIQYLKYIGVIRDILLLLIPYLIQAWIYLISDPLSFLFGNPQLLPLPRTWIFKFQKQSNEKQRIIIIIMMVGCTLGQLVRLDLSFLSTIDVLLMGLGETDAV